MGMVFNNGYINSETYEDNFSRSLRIEGQVAVADLEFSIINVTDYDKPVTIQARLDSLVSQTCRCCFGRPTPR